MPLSLGPLFILIGIGALIYAYTMRKAFLRSVEEAQRLRDENKSLEFENKLVSDKLQQKEEMWKESQKNLQDTIRLFAKEALLETQNSLLSIAEKSFGVRDEKTMKPLQESFERMNRSFSDLKIVCQTDIGALKEHVDKVQKEASRLSKALTEPTIRGKWGEMHLRRAVEIAGMLPYVDFIEQDSLSSRLRPDMIIRLPMNRTIVVDAKTPFMARNEATEQNDPEEKRIKLQEYVAQVLDHIKRLGKKEYWISCEKAPDFVVMYLPGEAFLLDALFHDASIIEESSKRRVVLATPMTLIAILKLISQCWNEAELEKNVEKVIFEAKRCLNNMKKYVGETSKVERSLTKSLELFHHSQKTLEGVLLPSLQTLSSTLPEKESGEPVSLQTIVEEKVVLEVDSLGDEDVNKKIQIEV